MANKWHYSGEVSLENGGYFYDKSNIQYGYVDVVRVQPCSDAGGPDNEWWVEQLTVNLPETDKALGIILRVCGWTVDEVSGKTKPEREAMVIDACIAYGAYDIDRSAVYRIGPKQDGKPFRWDGHNENSVTQFRGNASLRIQVKKVFMGGSA